MLTLKENMLRIFNHQEPEYLPLNSDIIVAVCSINKTSSVVEPNESIAYDWFDRRWIYEENIGASTVDVNNPILNDITQWKEVIQFPDLSTLDWEKAASLDSTGWNREEKLVRFPLTSGPWENLYYSMNFADALCALEENPDDCFDFFSAFADFSIDLAGYIIKYYKPDVITLHDDYGMGTGPFMSPETWRKLIKPNLKRIVDFVKSEGLIYQHHNCGFGASLVEEMADDLGIESWQQVHVSNDPVNLYKRIGQKVTLIDGLIDVAKLDSDGVSEEEIRKEVRKVADDICPGGAPVVISASVASRLEVRAIVNDELTKYAQKYYRNQRPSV